MTDSKQQNWQILPLCNNDIKQDVKGGLESNEKEGF